MRRLYATAMSFCSFVRLSSVKCVKSFATWQHMAARVGGAFRIVSGTLVNCLMNFSISNILDIVLRVAVVQCDITQ